MRLTIRKSDFMTDWYIIERAEHDGRVWLEKIDEHAMAVRMSSRFSDADVEGTGDEMIELAEAIKNRSDVSFERCAVEMRGESVAFWSPRNSTHDGVVPYTDALELAALIREKLRDGQQLAMEDRT